ncbi:MAG: NADH-quinone oxidoreductase subunit L [Chloroflexi bacterium]|nr:NADH-quinone oxidoreductase subunit L [Chloroflexota bacterium]MDA1002054.1 NADH-quinone oxidoreductase subunit L [Chloroflexota bacterium]MQC27559.1 NADH-quinone oxidoreductase subunit L [Chloroflexota bacterium]
MGMEQVWVLPAILAGVFVVVALFNRLLPHRGDFLAILGMLAVVALVALVLLDFQGAFVGGHFDPAGTNVYAFDWLTIGHDFFTIQFSTFVDSITVVMLVVVSFVALMVMLYSVGYMHGEPRYGWYFALLAFFTAAMLTLVISGNLIQLYLAWEGVGLASYLLIGFYWERRTAAEAAKKAFITTRIGDVGLLIGIILLWRATGSFDIQTIIAAARSGAIDETYLTVAMLLLFAGAAGKSAQFPLHVWLPDAMEGPTPVSALIHAATMVVAGVYLVARFSPVFAEVLVARDVVLYVGLLTAVMAATMALVENDIKRVLAYSTVSQLGFMFVALGAGAVTAAMFHLFTHAFFKSLLFLGSGSVIHATEHQTVEQLGGLRRKMPITTLTFVVGGLALAGVPIFAGFWSKDEILVAVNEGAALPVYAILALTAGLTALYTTRLILLTFFGEPKNQHAFEHAHESPPPMLGPLVILAALATVAGFVALDGVGRALGFAGGIGEILYLSSPHHFEFNAMLALASTVVAVGAIGIGWAYWSGTAERATRARLWAPELHQLLVRRYYMDDLYQALINRVILGLAGVVAWFDKRVVNETGVDGGAQLLGFFGYRLKFLQTGKIPNYALAMAVGLTAIVLVAFGRQ